MCRVCFYVIKNVENLWNKLTFSKYQRRVFFYVSHFMLGLLKSIRDASISFLDQTFIMKWVLNANLIQGFSSGRGSE